MLSNSQLRNTLGNFFENSQFDDQALRPASIDLSVGRIFVPPDDDKESPSSVTNYVVPVGGTLVVETMETLNIPATHAGLMFPKSSTLAEKGILITNFGCVDPGYQGPLKFVVINLGRRAFGFRRGDRIVTLALFKLDETAKPDYQTFIRDKPVGPSLEETCKLLAHDFVEVERRANREAKRTVLNSALGFGVVISLFIVIPSVLIALAPPLLEKKFSYGQYDIRLDEIEEQLETKFQSIDQDFRKINREFQELRQQ